MTIERDGLTIAALDWGSDGRPLLLMHPNGFCAGIWDPLAQQLRGDYRPIAIDIRGHGASEPAPYRRRVRVRGRGIRHRAVLDALGVQEVVALGHSLGGACVILLDHLFPGIVQRERSCARRSRSRRSPGALLRTARTGSWSSARRRRAEWPDRAPVQGVVREPSTAERPRAGGARRVRAVGIPRSPRRNRRARCAPEVEARFFEAAATETERASAFDALRALRGRATVVRGDRTDLPGLIFAAQAEAVGAPLVELSGDHFFLQENTARAGRARPRPPLTR